MSTSSIIPSLNKSQAAIQELDKYAETCVLEKPVNQTPILKITKLTLSETDTSTTICEKFKKILPFQLHLINSDITDPLLEALVDLREVTNLQLESCTMEEEIAQFLTIERVKEQVLFKDCLFIDDPTTSKGEKAGYDLGVTNVGAETAIYNPDLMRLAPEYTPISDELTADLYKLTLDELTANLDGFLDKAWAEQINIAKDLIINASYSLKKFRFYCKHISSSSHFKGTYTKYHDKTKEIETNVLESISSLERIFEEYENSSNKEILAEKISSVRVNLNKCYHDMELMPFYERINYSEMA